MNRAELRKRCLALWYCSAPAAEMKTLTAIEEVRIKALVVGGGPQLVREQATAELDNLLAGNPEAAPIAASARDATRGTELLSMLRQSGWRVYEERLDGDSIAICFPNSITTLPKLVRIVETMLEGLRTDAASERITSFGGDA